MLNTGILYAYVCFISIHPAVFCISRLAIIEKPGLLILPRALLLQPGARFCPCSSVALFAVKPGAQNTIETCVFRAAV